MLHPVYHARATPIMLEVMPIVLSVICRGRDAGKASANSAMGFGAGRLSPSARTHCNARSTRSSSGRLQCVEDAPAPSCSAPPT